VHMSVPQNRYFYQSGEQWGKVVENPMNAPYFDSVLAVKWGKLVIFLIYEVKLDYRFLARTVALSIVTLCTVGMFVSMPDLSN
jgi:hypothetical protein